MAPGTREEVLRERGDNDDETLKPHADVHKHAGNENDPVIGAHLLRPEDLRNDDVAGHHAVVGPRIPTAVVIADARTEEGEALVLVAAVVGNEQLDQVGVTHDRAGQQDDLGHLIDVLARDQVVEMFVKEPGGKQDGEHHREAAEDRARDEVRREDRGVPAGQDRGREVEGNDRVNREHQRRGEAGEDEIRHLVVTPLPVRSAPAERENAVDVFGHPRLGPVAQGREIGDQAGKPKQDGHGEVSRDREYVPEQRGAEVRPDAVGIRDRCQEPRHPHATYVDAGEDTRAHHRKERHCLRRAVDRRAPLLACEEKDRRDERAGVSDTDPEHEVGNIPRPTIRVVFPPGPDAIRDLVADAEEAEGRYGRAGQECEPPP